MIKQWLKSTAMNYRENLTWQTVAKQFFQSLSKESLTFLYALLKTLSGQEGNAEEDVHQKN